MSEVNVRKRKANKGKWHQNFAKKRKFALCPELKGFLLFCNCKEKETIREAYVLLNQFADRMYGPEMGVQKVGTIHSLVISYLRQFPPPPVDTMYTFKIRIDF